MTLVTTAVILGVNFIISARIESCHASRALICILFIDHSSVWKSNWITSEDKEDGKLHFGLTSG